MPQKKANAPKGDVLTDTTLSKILLDTHFVSKEDLGLATDAAKKQRTSLFESLLSTGVLTQDLIGQAVGEFLGVPYADLSSHPVSTDVAARLPEDVARAHGIVLVAEERASVTLASSDPSSEAARDAAALAFPKKKILFSFAFPDEIAAAMRAYRKPLATRFAALMQEETRFAPNIIDQIFEDAVANRASDIHFEPFEADVQIRFRVDGVLQEAARFPKDRYEFILNRIKVLGHLRIDVHFSAQDGSIRMRVAGRPVDARVSIVPTLEGETVVIRLLAEYVRGLLLSDLGFSERDLALVAAAAKKPFGMILAVGPTGSGKTTSMYALLKTVQRPEINVTTIEDPVEYRIPGVNQIQVNAATNLAFSQGLRAIVRQDPNVILVGEIRDRETAEIAVNAALTGHLLLSTFHANDAATAIPRLLDMGVEPFLLASTLELVVAQRLARRICQECRYGVAYARADIARLSSGAAAYFSRGLKAYAGKGCAACNHTGYRGRVALIECVRMTPELQTLLLKRPSTHEIVALARTQGFVTMFEDGIEKVANGITTLEELVRVAVPPAYADRNRKGT